MSASIPAPPSFQTRIQALAKTPLFQPRELLPGITSYEEQRQISLQRTFAIGKAMAPSLETVQNLPDEWWHIHSDPIFSVDGASYVLLSIQLNLIVQTLSTYLDKQPGLKPLIDQLLQFDIMGQFCLSEVDHGLDARNIETIVTRLPNGDLILHTPHPGASKYMPPSAPRGIPGVGLVFARLIVDGEDRGIRGFVVPISDGQKTYTGITVRVLGGRPGTKPVEHCITTFNNVRLPKSALLGSLDKPENERRHFQELIWAVACGAIVFAAPVITCLRISAYIASTYSQRRTVAGHGKGSPRVPIISFKTQYRPVLIAIAHAHVLKALYWSTARFFRDLSNPMELRHAMATILKLLVQRTVQEDMFVLSERCGGQGLMGYNQIAAFCDEMRGSATAEGDAVVLSLRLIAELVIGRYDLPEPKDSNNILYKHEQGLFAETREAISQIKHHRSDLFNRLVLPRCEKMTMSIGHRVAYEAGVAAGLSPQLTDLYLASAVRTDEGWYSEKMGYSRESQFRAEDDALQAALPFLKQWTEELDVKEYAWAPILSDEKWAEFFNSREVAPCYGDSVKSKL
ncbi:hypothetical protein D9611_002989 [Ephemerocybe angulata]|uniref:Acyl-CoA oxidase C-alpha1 domain-containing protein n=1 Tax=Ephemerocybe angulata TaxID=980116 RepID=A0A8H5C893_9AGAR|nr:hypothetical protein D9611_002989 [Tulosesus angulatus]